MKSIFKLLTLSLLAMGAVAASDMEQECKKNDHTPAFHMTVATQNDGDIEFYGDATTFWIKSVLTQKILAKEKSLNRIKRIDLSDMELTGDFPREIGLLPNLKELDLSKNLLTGFDGSMFENKDKCDRWISIGIHNNPLKTFIGSQNNVILRLMDDNNCTNIHLDPTIFKSDDFSDPLKHLFKGNIQRDVGEELWAMLCIRIEFYQDIPIPQSLTEQFGITHDGYDLVYPSRSTVITRQLSMGHPATCSLSVDYLVNRHPGEPLLNALKAVLVNLEKQEAEQ